MFYSPSLLISANYLNSLLPTYLLSYPLLLFPYFLFLSSLIFYHHFFPFTTIRTYTIQGPESNTPEVVCEGNVSTITSGGGFSRFFQRPDFQLSSVLSFFTSAVAAGHKPMSGYGLGRGYPDISLAGYNYYTVIGGQFHLLSGTSASCPTLAGLISNINSDRIKINKGSLGWLNPTIYLYSNLFTNDITSGNNLCVAKDICCPQGFFATPGWDPTTGLGSINYGNFHDKLVSLGTVNILTSFPSLDPTLFPTSAPFTERSSVGENFLMSSIMMHIYLLPLPFLSFAVYNFFLFVFFFHLPLLPLLSLPSFFFLSSSSSSFFLIIIFFFSFFFFIVLLTHFDFHLLYYVSDVNSFK